jgi:hypothetical protein
MNSSKQGLGGERPNSDKKDYGKENMDTTEVLMGR